MTRNDRHCRVDVAVRQEVDSVGRNEYYIYKKVQKNINKSLKKSQKKIKVEKLQKKSNCTVVQCGFPECVEYIYMQLRFGA